MEKIGIYIHIPFCRRTCFYCHFVKQEYDAELLDRYIDVLVKELRLKANPAYLIDTIYIGGGSPSLLNDRQVGKLVEAIGKIFSLDSRVEFSIEMNPEDVSAEKLKFLKQYGVNRLSIGVQSFNAPDLEYLQRTQGIEQAMIAVESAQSMDFSNINADFIISLPTQNTDALVENFTTLMNYKLPHVSTYILEDTGSETVPGGADCNIKQLEGVHGGKHKKKTRGRKGKKDPGSKLLEAGVEAEVKEERDNDHYFFTRGFLAPLGYEHYEISNFSKIGFQCKHNLKYWKNENYIGAGLSASGYEAGVDYRNTNDMGDYLRQVERGKLPQAEKSILDPELRRIVMGLRLLRGISADCFIDYRKELDFLLAGGMLIRKNDRIAVKPLKLLLLNEILTYFI
jgi:oxygen-independent coproporphyrinogen-3 oxidase